MRFVTREFYRRGKKGLYIPSMFYNQSKEREVKKMGTILAKNVVKRKPGYLYYVDGKGNVCEAKMARGGKKKKK